MGKKIGRPLRDDIQRGSGSCEGLPFEYTRSTIIMKKNTLQFLRDYAYTKRITIKDALELMIVKFAADYVSDQNNEKLISRNQRNE